MQKGELLRNHIYWESLLSSEFGNDHGICTFVNLNNVVGGKSIIVFVYSVWFLEMPTSMKPTGLLWAVQPFEGLEDDVEVYSHLH